MIKNRLRSKLYYLANKKKQIRKMKKWYKINKENHNAQRKKYKKLPWKLRADNPKNKVKKVELH